MQVSTLRPGLLVSLKTSVTGNVSYRKNDIEPEHYTGDGTKRAVWQTLKTVADPAEHEEATRVRSQIRTLVTAQCAPSSFGLLCPDARREELDAAIREARQLANVFNSRAALTRVGVYVIAGRIAADDLEAVRAINGEVRDLLRMMEDGLRNLDAGAVRDAANKARALGSMLSPYAAEQVKKAIDVARSAARQIVKAGESAAVEIDAATLRTIGNARVAFLDLDGENEVESLPVPETTRAVDFEPIPYETAPAKPQAVLDFA